MNKENKIKLLVNEATNEMTKMNTQNERYKSSIEANHEAEAMYFRDMRLFFGNSIAYFINQRNQDVMSDELKLKREKNK